MMTLKFRLLLFHEYAVYTYRLTTCVEIALCFIY
jgi:hypothetical protein